MCFLKAFFEKIKNKHKERDQACENFIILIETSLNAIKAILSDHASFGNLGKIFEHKNAAEMLLTRTENTQINDLKRARLFKKLTNKRMLLKEHLDLLNQRVFEYEEQIRINRSCNILIDRIDSALQDALLLFRDPFAYINPDRADTWSKRYNDLIQENIQHKLTPHIRADRFHVLQEKQKALCDTFNTIRSRILLHNDNVIKNAYRLIGDVEGKQLDRQQMTCIVKNAHNHLVVAGAGTGKTTTVVGKIKYLLKTGRYNPEDILVLSFTKASAEEMRQRINQETGCEIETSTFHKLGLSIITKANRITPKITQLNLREFIKEQIQTHMLSNTYLNELSLYLFYNRVVCKSEFDFKTQSEYEDYLMLNPPTTINDEIVKSYGEMDIANFLIQNGIRYEYEPAYKIDTRTLEYRQYHPDFYLPDYDIYIEYFGINKDGEVPSYFKGTGRMTATQAYQESIKWKRNTHQTHGTTMIECYAYEKFDGVLLDHLKEKLLAKEITLVPKTGKELWEQVSANNHSVLDGVVELFETVINLIKSNGYTIDTVKKLSIGHSNAQENHMLLSILEPVFNAYCTYLQKHKEIDFNDMINVATQYVTQRRFFNPYKYIIVDEYQDISKSRFLLLNSLRESNNYDLFCVGDDWQSIYRFAGSDVSYILNFQQYWGAAELSKIETTYRFSQKLIEISSYFVMQNPIQIKKQILGKQHAIGFALGEIYGYTEANAIEFAAKRVDDLPKGSSVYFIGRYSFDAKFLSDSGIFTCEYSNANGAVEVKYRNRPDLKMFFMTAHRSKGLQADYVFIINNKASKMGFPSKIQDAAILDLLLDNCDEYPYAEERRLFYVALTRAKQKVFLVTVRNMESEFVDELRAKYAKELRQEQWECPLCGGRLSKKSGPYGEFFGCSNYRTTGCRYIRKKKLTTS